MKFYIVSLVFLCAISTPLYAMQASVEDAEIDDENRILPIFDTTWLRDKATKRLPETITSEQKKERIVQEAVARFIDNKNNHSDYKALAELLKAVTNPQDTYTSLEKVGRREVKSDIDWLVKEAITHITQQDTNDALSLAKRQKIQKWIFLGLTGAAALIAFFEPSLMAAICKGTLGD